MRGPESEMPPSCRHGPGGACLQRIAGPDVGLSGAGTWLQEVEDMARAIWNGSVVAESDEVELVEGNVYFLPDSVRGRPRE